MEPIHLLDEIPFDLDVVALRKRLHIAEGSAYAAEFENVSAGVAELARPKALYRPVYVQERTEDSIVVEGIRLQSRVLSVNTAAAYRLFAYVATCGVELAQWAHTLEDALQRYWADAIQELAVRQAMQALKQDLEQHYCPGQTAAMSPGSLEDWPISEQEPLFQLLGDTRSTVGVTLTESLLMLPTKSISGVRFPTAEHFESCQLCSRPDCPGRRAAYDPSLYARRYRPDAEADH